MSRFPEGGRAGGAGRRVPALLALVVVAGGALAGWWLTGRPAGPQAPQGGPAGAAVAVAPGGSGVADSPFGAGSAAQAGAGLALPLAALPAPAQAAAREIERLAALPAGDEAIALARRLEDGADAASLPAWRLALLGSSSAAIERSAVTVLARLADAETIAALGQDYGRLPPERRGRILQVLENASRPEALDGLVRIAEGDSDEKRSALSMSAMHGLAHLGTMDATDYLLQQVRTPVIDHALMALAGVGTRQGVEMMRAAADGSRGFESLDAGTRQALRRTAAAAEARLAR
ncbi:hypothetical protein [Sphaerotilus uruguayifluvii]|uniref:HEAT repeat domain-containing protein n=1 Tax=Sphaerotilus uruguayifluvii TaxID=2735897 RepID=A0ABX2G834_9BURK|nr:hypothetical protein [Leptothrix sp. C29]NRT57906.1 hypothetical protein [Leptothrix sp. C29]